MDLQDKTILIQGALDIEIDYLISQLQNRETKIIAGYEFNIGKINNIKVIISKTHIGMVNATTATTIGIMSFQPELVINQGIAGSYKSDINVGDIIIGKDCCNINSYSMPVKDKGEGSNPMEWEPSKRAKEKQVADIETVNFIYEFLKTNHEKPVYVGTLGSGDVFNREVDRINWINNRFNNLSEDMESIGVYTVCNKFNTPCVGIRIISNNEITRERISEGKNEAKNLQNILIKLLNNTID